MERPELLRWLIVWFIAGMTAKMGYDCILWHIRKSQIAKRRKKRRN